MTAIIQHAGDLLKRYSPSNIPIHLPFKIQTVKIKKQQEIGQHRGWEPCLRDGRDFQQSIDYSHYHPLKHGLVKRASDL